METSDRFRKREWMVDDNGKVVRLLLDNQNIWWGMDKLAIEKSSFVVETIRDNLKNHILKEPEHGTWGHYAWIKLV